MKGPRWPALATITAPDSGSIRTQTAVTNRSGSLPATIASFSSDSTARRRLAAREVLPHQPAQARHRNGRARAVAADVGHEHRDLTLAVLDDLEEVAAVADGSVLPGRDAQLAPGRQMHQLRPAVRDLRLDDLAGACCYQVGSRRRKEPSVSRLDR